MIIRAGEDATFNDLWNLRCDDVDEVALYHLTSLACLTKAIEDQQCTPHHERLQVRSDAKSDSEERGEGRKPRTVA